MNNDDDERQHDMEDEAKEVVKKDPRLFEGPLSVFNECFENGVDIGIVCRDQKRRMTGTVHATDNQWFFMMQNVEEVWVEKHKKSKEKKIRQIFRKNVIVNGDIIQSVVINPKDDFLKWMDDRQTIKLPN